MDSLAKKTQRLDVRLVTQGWCVSRAVAQSLVMNGQVLVGGQKVTKAGTLVSDDADITLLGEMPKYVSRGGLKLEGALRSFDISVMNQWVLDIGISTGGFTDCVLQLGAKGVIGLDVGYGQLDYRIRQDPRVMLIERFNARYATPDTLAGVGIGPDHLQRVSRVVMDVSFISVTKLLPQWATLLPNADFIVLIKPQFEALPSEVGKGGVMSDPLVIQCVVDRVATSLDPFFCLHQRVWSPLKGAKGNQEVFFWLTPRSKESVSHENHPT
ncbi:TlyA family RNA methyltransferase [bacterium]|nr:TlyA family RNA methyltransferase [bacterium]